MWKIAAKYPDIVSKLVVGVSSEGRELRGLRIFPGGDKPIFLIEGGIHAQEWLSTSTAVYIIHALLHFPKNNDAYSFEWHIFPSINPDGYEYSFSKGNLGSRTPQSRTFPGPGPFSEPETRALATHVLQSLPRLLVYVALHCSRQCILIPWGYTKDRAPDHDRLMDVAVKAGEAFGSAHGMHPLVGPISTTLYVASGNSVDWVYSQGVKFPFAFELRHLKPGSRFHGPDEIGPAAQETLNSIFVILEEALAYYHSPAFAEAETRASTLSSNRPCSPT